jgi:hypothetical protein
MFKAATVARRGQAAFDEPLGLNCAFMPQLNVGTAFA